MYFVIYWQTGDTTPTQGGSFATLASAQSAVNWFKTLQGIVAVQVLECAASVAQTWGTIPT